MTPDAHPIHIHLIQFQVINVQPFNTEADLCPYTGQGNFDFSGPQYRADWDSLFPGRHVQRVHLPGRYVHPRLRTAAGLRDGERRRRHRRQPRLRRAASDQYFVGPPVPPDPRDSGLEGHLQDVPVRGHANRRSLGAAGRRRGPDARPGRIPSPSIRPREDPGYVWHCHILDHEDNEMMRPIVIAK